MEWINLLGDVTLRQSWSIKFVIANRAVRAELNGKCAAQACLWVYSTAEDTGLQFDSAARPIYSAALVHMLTWTATSLGFYIQISAALLMRRQMSKKEKKKKERSNCYTS